MASDPNLQKRLIFSILEYLQEVRNQEGIEAESIEVAIQCLGTAFELDVTEPKHQQLYSIKPLTLPSAFSLGLSAGKEQSDVISNQMGELQMDAQKKKDIYDLGDPSLNTTFARCIERLKKDQKYFAGVAEDSPEYIQRVELAKAKFLSMQQHQQQQQTSPQQFPTKPYQSPPITTTTTSQIKTPSQQAKELAEKYKFEGNANLSSNLFPEAIKSYTNAIELNPDNPIYYCNRAAAYSHLQQYEKAIEDCNLSISKDPNYSKAYSRLGLAYFNLGKYKEAIEFGYKKALELEPENQSFKNSLAQVEAKLRQSSPSDGSTQPPTQPNIADLLNNPVLADLARNITATNPNLAAGLSGAGGSPPNLNNLLNNPEMMSMFQNIMTQPGFSEMMNDPNVINMAQSVAQNPATMNQLLQGMFSGAPSPPSQSPPSQP